MSGDCGDDGGEWAVEPLGVEILLSLKEGDDPPKPTVGRRLHSPTRGGILLSLKEGDGPEFSPLRRADDLPELWGGVSTVRLGTESSSPLRRATDLNSLP